ncbi:hypothetical protein AAG906_000469 [Vitis piasezkii]
MTQLTRFGISKVRRRDGMDSCGSIQDGERSGGSPQIDAVSTPPPPLQKLVLRNLQRAYKVHLFLPFHLLTGKCRRDNLLKGRASTGGTFNSFLWAADVIPVSTNGLGNTLKM